MKLLSNYFNPETYLAHHGILGQKWGIRRFQNPDGTLTAAGKKRQAKEEAKEKARQEKQAAKEARAYRNDIISKAIDYDEEFDQTEEGSKLLREYHKQINIMENDEDWDDDETKQDAFWDAETSYLRAQGAYSARRLLESDGVKGVEALLSGYRYKNPPANVDELIDRVSDHYTNVHRY